MIKQFRITILTIFILLVGATLSVQAEDEATAGKGLRPHSLFQSNMVIQRSKPINVWGWSTPGDQIKVTFASKTATVTAAKDRSWKATLPAMEASSKPTMMTIEGKSRKITLDNILIGDVWVLAGQSNMAMAISRVENGKLEVAAANFPKIRMLSVPQIFGPELKKNFSRSEGTSAGDWGVCSPETVSGLSALGYVMARRLHMVTQIPIGVINTSRGGTTVEAWTPMALLRKSTVPAIKELVAKHDQRLADFDPAVALAKQISKYEGKVASMKKKGQKIPASMKPPTGPVKDSHRHTHRPPGNCFASVTSPIAGFAVKGTIWHQGYNNCFDGVNGATMYRAVFPELIRGWREAFQDRAMPFGILSQCTAGNKQSRENFLPSMTDIGARLREVQYQTFLDFYKAGDKNIGFVSTYDLSRAGYHPGVKIPAGERAAVWALATQYGMEKDMSWCPPALKEMKAEDGTILLTYDHTVAPVADGSKISGFAIAGKDMKFQLAEASHRVISRSGKGRRAKIKYDKTTLVLKSSLVPEPLHYRYAWSRNPMGNLRRSVRWGNDIPLPTQRSDKWSNADLLKALTGKEAINPSKLDKGENRLLKMALESEDQRRLIEEAKALLQKVQEKEENVK